MPIDAAWIALGGTVVGGVIGIAGKTLSDWLAVYKDREAREHQRNVEFQKWQREQLQVCVSASMRAINLYIAKAVTFKDSGNDVAPLQNDAEIRTMSSEVQTQLTNIVLLYPDRAGEEFDRLFSQVDETMWQAVPMVKQLWPVRQQILRLARQFRYEAFPPQ